MNIKELYEKRLLRKITPDLEKSKKSLEVSENFLKEAKKLKDFDKKLVILTAYTSMFHSARAVLYKDGIQEKSHYAVFMYLKENYKNELNELIFEFNSAREQRHEGMYGLDFEFDEDDCNHIVKKSEEFLNKIKTILNPSSLD